MKELLCVRDLGGMARNLAIAVALVLGSLATSATAEADEGTVRLNNGGVISGEIVVYVPGVRVSVRAADGQVYTFEAAEIASVDVQGGAPPAQPAQPAPQPQPQGGVPIVEDTQQPQQGAVPPPAPQAQPAPGVQPGPGVQPAGPGAYGQPAPAPVGGPSYAPQPGALTQGSRAQLEAERQQLLRQMPGVGPQVMGMVLAGIVTVVGASFWAVSSQDFDSSISSPFFGEGCNSTFDDCNWSTGMVVGMVFMVVGPILLLVNTLVMIANSARRGRIKRRIREIDQQLREMQSVGGVRIDVMAGAGRAGLTFGAQF